LSESSSLVSRMVFVKVSTCAFAFALCNRFIYCDLQRNRGPSVNPSFLTLTKDEIEEMEQRKQRYRDRAAERRTLHRGFGTGPGQKGMPVHEMEKLEAETATEMPTALAKAAKARPLGSDNIGKRMLQGMGWKEVSPKYLQFYVIINHPFQVRW
jgi:hypothetical protein